MIPNHIKAAIESRFPEANVVLREDYNLTGLGVEFHGWRNAWIVLDERRWGKVLDQALDWLGKVAQSPPATRH